MSLLDAGDTLSLNVTETGEVLDTVTYSSDDGAKKDGQTLHVYEGALFAGPPSPGMPSASFAGQQELDALPEDESSDADGVRPTVSVAHVNGQSVPSGQNLFFTTSDSVRTSFTVIDDTTRYTPDTAVSQYDLNLLTSARNTSFHVTDPVMRNGNDGLFHVDYTVHFSRQSDGSVRDNRVALSLRVRDDGGRENDIKNDLVIVRNTIAPVIMSATTDSELLFSGTAAENVIIPVRVSGVQWAIGYG